MLAVEAARGFLSRRQIPNVNRRIAGGSTCLLSDVNATLVTASLCRRSFDELAAVEIKNSHRFIDAAGCDIAPVRRRGDGVNIVGMAGVLANLVAGSNVPQVNFLVVAAGQ